MKRMPEPTWEGKVKLSDGYERQVCQFGNGSNVLIGLHGGPGASLQSLLPLGRMADDDLRIVIYDQIEGGGSDRPGRDDLLTVEGFAHEFDDLVTTMDLGKVHVLGHSWGGMLALECALRSPHLVKSTGSLRNAGQHQDRDRRLRRANRRGIRRGPCSGGCR